MGAPRERQLKNEDIATECTESTEKTRRARIIILALSLRPLCSPWLLCFRGYFSAGSGSLTAGSWWALRSKGFCVGFYCHPAASRFMTPTPSFFPAPTTDVLTCPPTRL